MSSYIITTFLWRGIAFGVDVDPVFTISISLSSLGLAKVKLYLVHFLSSAIHFFALQ